MVGKGSGYFMIFLGTSSVLNLTTLVIFIYGEILLIAGRLPSCGRCGPRKRDRQAQAHAHTEVLSEQKLIGTLR